MKLFFKLIIVLSFGCLHSQSQILEVSSSRNKSRTSLPPIEVIIDSVLKNNAQLDYRKNSIKRIETDIASKRIDLTQYMGFGGDSRYGNFNSFSTSENDILTSALASTSKQFNYSVGVYFKISLYDILNKKKQMKSARLELEEAKSLAESQEEYMRQEVIKLYQEIILKERLLEIKAKSFGNGKVNMQMVEKEFRNGIVDVAEYVRITSGASTLEIEYEKAKSEFVLAKHLLEDLAGFKFDIVATK